MNNVESFDLEQQVCFRSVESAKSLIQRLSLEEVERCLRYERGHKNRSQMVALLHQQRVTLLFTQLHEPPVLLTREEAIRIKTALNAARSHIKCGAPASADTHTELTAAAQLLADATNAPA